MYSAEIQSDNDHVQILECGECTDLSSNAIVSVLKEKPHALKQMSQGNVNV